DRLVVDALVAETLVVELEALEFHARAAVPGRPGLVAEEHVAEVRVAGDGADGGELLRDVLDHERRVGGGRERFQEAGVGHGTASVGESQRRPWSRGGRAGGVRRAFWSPRTARAMPPETAPIVAPLPASPLSEPIASPPRAPTAAPERAPC